MNANEILAEVDRSGGSIIAVKHKLSIRAPKLQREFLTFIHENAGELIPLLRITSGRRGLVCWRCRTCTRRCLATAMPGMCRCSARFWCRTGYTEVDGKGRPLPVVQAERDIAPVRMQRWRCTQCNTAVDAIQMPARCSFCGTHKLNEEGRCWWQRIFRWAS
jgi:hypothetical protein